MDIKNILTLRHLKKLNKMKLSYIELSNLIEKIMLENFKYKYQAFDTTNNNAMLVYNKIEILDNLVTNYNVYITISDEDNKITSVIENKTTSKTTIHI